MQFILIFWNVVNRVIGKIIFMMTPVDVDKAEFYWFLPPRFRGDYDIWS